MLYKCIPFEGLRIVINPETRRKDPETGALMRTKGKYIKFEKGRYRTGQRNDMTEKEEIARLDVYSKRWPGELVKIDEKKLAEEKKFVDKAKMAAAKAWKEREAAREKAVEADAKRIEGAREAESKVTFERKQKEAKERRVAEIAAERQKRADARERMEKIEAAEERGEKEKKEMDAALEDGEEIPEPAKRGRGIFSKKE